MNHSGKHLLVTAGLVLALGLALALVGLLAHPSQPAQAQSGSGVIRVATTGSDGPACGGEGNPCRTVQYAVDQAVPGEEIRVATGVYSGVNSYAGLSQVVYISKTVTLRGGYTTANWTTPDPEANPTTLDAQGQGRVLYVTGAISPIFKGLRLTGGDATGLAGGDPGGADSGGGVYVVSATVTISGCVVDDNTASTADGAYAGGLYFYDSNATLSGNIVQHNTASSAGAGYGGGLLFYLSTPTLSGNTVLSNTASTAGTGQGGGMYLHTSSVTVSDNIIEGNTASTIGEGRGGGMLFYLSPATLSRNTVRRNTASAAADGYGGGLEIISCGIATLEANTVVSNTATLSPTATGEGGGLRVWSTSPFTLTNNVVADNHANTYGAGVSVASDAGLEVTGHLLHNTIADNHACGQGVRAGPYSTLYLTNTIIAGNTGYGVCVGGGSLDLEYTVFHGNGYHWGSCGGGGISVGYYILADPAFADPANWDYHITLGSAAFDAGMDAGVSADIDGDPRPAHYGYDIGADEYCTCWARLNDDPTPYVVQAAVDASTQPSDVVKVAGHCVGVNDRGGGAQTVYLSKTLTIRGGYTTTNWTDPDPQANPTILDAEGQGRVLYVSADISPTIEGLHITGGDATALGALGGGVYIRDAAATVNNCHIYSNTASTAGGGGGGGLYLLESNATLSGNRILSNTASSAGGLFVGSGSCNLTNNLLAGNQANTYGSALVFWTTWPSTNANLLHNTIAHNHGGGQAVFVGWNATVAFTNTIIAGHATAALFAESGCTATLEATLWHGNGTDTAGEGTVVSSTNLYGDPAFADPANWDYHLGGGSAAIDAGVDAGVTEDLDGLSRPQGHGYDLGAYEFVNQAPTLGAVDPSSGSGPTGVTTSFTTTWKDANGWQDLKQCYFHIGDSPSIVGNVTLMYNAVKNKLWMRTDDGSAWFGGHAPESANTMENSQAIVHCNLTTMQGDGDTLSVAWAIEFKPGYTGTKKTGLKCKDRSKAKAKGKWKGTWTITP
jgi:hypothetical protein